MAGFRWFKAGANLHDVNVSGEPVSADTVAAREFPENLWEIIDEGITLSGFLMWIKWDCPGRGCHTKITSVRRKSWCQAIKWQRQTCLVAVLPVKWSWSLSVHHSENPRALKNTATGSLPVVWKSNPKPWLTQAIFQDWFFHHLIPQVEKYCLE